MLKNIITLGLIMAALLFVTAYFFQRQFIYFPLKETPERHLVGADDMDIIKLETPDHVMLNAWYKPAADGQPTMLYLHGNAGNIGSRMPVISQFLEQGFGVLLLEYRGYGGNGGDPTEEGLYQDGRAAMNFLDKQYIDSNQLILYGESLGTGVATKLATEFSVCAVILQSPYTSLTDLARYHYPWLPIPLYDRYDSLHRINNIKSPILFLQGSQDDVVPYAQAYTLFNQANEPKQWVNFKNGGHDDLWQSQTFMPVIKEFITTHCQTNS